jgi:uncharacterized protein (TIGR03083 family)
MAQPQQNFSRSAYVLAVRGFVELAGRIGSDSWDEPALGAWNVRDLTGHASRALITVESYLDPSTTTTEPDLLDAPAYYRASRASLADPAAVTERGRQAGVALGEDPGGAVIRLADRVLRLVESSPDEAVVTTPVGTMTLASYLTTRTFELVVHGLDLSAATGVPVPAQFEQPLLTCLHAAVEMAASAGGGAEVLLALTGRRPLSAGFSVV